MKGNVHPTPREWKMIEFFSLNGGCELCRGTALYKFAMEFYVDPDEIYKHANAVAVDRTYSAATEFKERWDEETRINVSRLILAGKS